MQKLKALRPSRFQKHANSADEKDINVTDSTQSPQNGVLDGNDQSRSYASEDTTLAPGTINGTPRTSRFGGVDVKRATRTRRNTIIFASLCFFISVIFLILTIIGNTHIKPVLKSTWFFKINISNIIPTTAGDAVLINSLARSLGLHDYYQVGLWNFCEGYNDQGIVSCSHPSIKYWFNPISIILDELLPGSTIALPSSVVSILHLVKIASNVMTALFITGTVINTVSALVTPIVILSRWWSLPIAIFSFLGALFSTAAAIIATVMWIIFRNVFLSEPSLNIEASLGGQMFTFMWIGAGFSILGWGANAGMGCCCASERDVRTGRRMGAKEGWPEGEVPVKEKKAKKVKGGKVWNERVGGMVRRLPGGFGRRSMREVDV